jgi:pimeloyl-[acyl-carrier protein] methyl ester esterase
MHKPAHLHLGPEYHLVFLHGWGMNSGIFSAFCEQLQGSFSQELNDTFSIRAIDLPGYGDNLNVSFEHHDIGDIALSVEEALPENSILIGWSLGGLIAQYLAAERSAKVAGLITLCSSPKFVQTAHWAGIAPTILESFMQQLELNHLRTLKRFLAIQSLGQASAKTDVQRMLLAIQKKPLAHPRTLTLGLQLLQHTDLRDRLTHIAVPSLRLYGQLDSLVPPSAKGLIDKLHPLATTQIYRKASHAPFISHPSSVITDILLFLTAFKKH